MRIEGTGITGFDFNVVKFKPMTTLALNWIQTSNGNWYATDRGIAADYYETIVSTYGKESYINNIALQLNSNRLAGSNQISLSSMNDGEKIFGADVDYTVLISAAVLNISKRVQKTWKGFGIELKLRHLSPSFLGSSSFPSTLKPDIGYLGSSTTHVSREDTYSGAFSFADNESDIGLFEGVFFFTNTEMRDLRRFIATERGSAFSLNSINGVNYLFGINRPPCPVFVKLIAWEDLGQEWNDHWKMKLTFAEDI